ncbi:MAG: prepilin peptidase [Pirellulales bacterium]|nr:prepilin peptidase [Pirellulales bacterium]
MPHAWSPPGPLDLQAGEALRRRARLQMVLAEAAAYVYLFAFGAILGSFLNVVVYRIPRGMGLLRPASRCPCCQTPIRLSDNLPLLGWVKLRGRCRACHLPISPRYPLVEALSGILWMGLAMAELFSGGANLPGYTPPRNVGALWLMWQPHWPLLRLYVYHALLLYLLVGLALIAADGFRPPRTMWLIWLALGALPPLAWPELHPVPVSASFAAWEAAGAARGALSVLAGGAAGAMGGCCLALAWQHRSQRADLVLGLAGVGAYLGWQAALGTCLLAAALAILAASLARLLSMARHVPSLMLVTGAAFIHVPCWRLLVELPAWPGPQAGPLALAITAAVAGAAAATAQMLIPPPSPYAATARAHAPHEPTSSADPQPPNNPAVDG